MRSLFVVSVVLVTGTSSLASAQSPSDFEFANGKIGNFALNARTEIEWHNGVPYVAGISCVGDNQDIRFAMDRTTQVKDLRLSFLGDAEPDGDRPYITLLGDALWLFVDGKRFEFRNVPMPTARFSNFNYAPTPEGTIVLADWKGYRAVRAPEANFFQNLTLIYGSLIDAEKLEWGFKSRNWKQVDRREPENALPNGWQRRRYSIDNRGLRAAVQWCSEAVTSDAARSLPVHLIGAMK